MISRGVLYMQEVIDLGSAHRVHVDGEHFLGFDLEWRWRRAAHPRDDFAGAFRLLASARMVLNAGGSPR
jgi:hypothetical protein